MESGFGLRVVGVCLLACLPAADGEPTDDRAEGSPAVRMSERPEEAIRRLTAAVQQDGEDVASWLALGRAHRRAGDLGEACKAFRVAAERSEYSLEALRDWGQAAFQARRWGDVKNAYGRVLARAPRDPISLYRRGIAYRETSKYKATIPRWLDWRRSERMFGRLVRQDSLYDDSLYQYALLKRLRQQFARAIELAERQVALKPGDSQTELGLYRIYQSFLDNKSSKEVVAWLREHGTDHAGNQLGEALRLAGMTAEADSVLRKCILSGLKGRVIPAHLSLARVNYELEEQRAAEDHFWLAVDAIRDTVDAALLFKDVKYVISDKEMSTFDRLSKAEDYPAYFRKLWISRDPTPSAAHNARLAEHYRRMLYAEKYYLYEGFRSWFEDPDKFDRIDFPPPFRMNDRFNDMGLVYIRHGAPWDVSKGPTFSESWRYSKTARLPRMQFHFVGNPSEWGSNWQLVEYPSGSGSPSMRVRWDVEKQIREVHRSIDLGFRTDRHTWGKEEEPLDTNVYVAVFGGVGDLRSLEIYYDVAIKQLGTIARTDADTSTAFEFGLSLHDEDWGLLHQQTGRETRGAVKTRRRGNRSIGMIRSEVRSDSCRIAFHIRPVDVGRLAVWKGGVGLTDYSRPELSVSSILPAVLVTPYPDEKAPIKRGDVYVAPNPSRRFDRNRPAYVYFEVYNLTPNERGVTAFETTYTITQVGRTNVQKVLSIFGSGERRETSVTIERLGETPMSAEYVALDLRKAGRGTFLLEMAVLDRNSGEEASETVEIELR